jgi:predicted PP-loop superfamily ATPase
MALIWAECRLDLKPIHHEQRDYEPSELAVAHAARRIVARVGLSGDRLSLRSKSASRTAKALNLSIPPSLQATADEVIE